MKGVHSFFSKLIPIRVMLTFVTSIMAATQSMDLSYLDISEPVFVRNLTECMALLVPRTTTQFSLNLSYVDEYRRTLRTNLSAPADNQLVECILHQRSCDWIVARTYNSCGFERYMLKPGRLIVYIISSLSAFLMRGHGHTDRKLEMFNPYRPFMRTESKSPTSPDKDDVINALSFLSISEKQTLKMTVRKIQTSIQGMLLKVYSELPYSMKQKALSASSSVEDFVVVFDYIKNTKFFTNIKGRLALTDEELRLLDSFSIKESPLGAVWSRVVQPRLQQYVSLSAQEMLVLSSTLAHFEASLTAMVPLLMWIQNTY